LGTQQRQGVLAPGRRSSDPCPSLTATSRSRNSTTAGEAARGTQLPGRARPVQGAGRLRDGLRLPVPGLFTWLVPRYGRFTKAAILHDFLCDEAKEGRFIRSQADGIFRRVMRELGVGFIRRWVMWAAVRLGSGWGVFQPSLWQSCSSSSSRRPRRRSCLPDGGYPGGACRLLDRRAAVLPGPEAIQQQAGQRATACPEAVVSNRCGCHALRDRKACVWAR
jgi:hypothetical protein